MTREANSWNKVSASLPYSICKNHVNSKMYRREKRDNQGLILHTFTIKYARLMWKVLTHGKASLLKIFNNIKHINWRPKSAGHPFPAKSTLFLKNWVIHTFPQNLTCLPELHCATILYCSYVCFEEHFKARVCYWLAWIQSLHHLLLVLLKTCSLCAMKMVQQILPLFASPSV